MQGEGFAAGRVGVTGGCRGTAGPPAHPELVLSSASHTCADAVPRQPMSAEALPSRRLSLLHGAGGSRLLRTDQ